MLNFPFLRTKESQNEITVDEVKHQNVLIEDKNLTLYFV